MCSGRGVSSRSQTRDKLQGGIVEILPNNVLADITLRNLRGLNGFAWDDDEVKFAAKFEYADAPIPLSSVSEVGVSGTIGRFD